MYRLSFWRWSEQQQEETTKKQNEAKLNTEPAAVAKYNINCRTSKYNTQVFILQSQLLFIVLCCCSSVLLLLALLFWPTTTQQLGSLRVSVTLFNTWQLSLVCFASEVVRIAMSEFERAVFRVYGEFLKCIISVLLSSHCLHLTPRHFKPIYTL